MFRARLAVFAFLGAVLAGVALASIAGAGPAAQAPSGASGDRPDPRARAQRDAWRERFGTSTYRYVDDAKHNLVYATCLDEKSHAQMQKMLEAQADQQSATLFGAPPEVEVFIAIAKPADAKAVIAGNQTSEGMYEHPVRRLVASDIGMVLRHEFTHLMHFGHMERLGQPHMIWVQEGIASLYENYDLHEDGSITFTPNLRHNQVRALASARTYTPFATLVALKPEGFMAKSQHLYPQVRSIFEYMADTGKLRKWYQRYTETFDQDRTGVKALEEVFGKRLAEIEADWRVWVLKRPAIATTAAADIRDMGVEVAGVTDGVQVRTAQRRGAASRAGLKVGDIITAVDGTPVRSPREFLAAVGASRRESVVLAVRRGAVEMQIQVQFSVANSAPRTAVTSTVVSTDGGWPDIRMERLSAGLLEMHS